MAPYLAAKAIVNNYYQLGFPNEKDPESPQDLVPKTGEYPVEIVNYSSVVLTKSPRVDQGKYQALEKYGKIKFDMDNNSAGFTEPGFGAILNFSQSWYVEGITNGSLLKCLPLAPGESTKIAVIDWQRSTSSSTGEEISQTESLSNTLSQKRAMEEIASATAKEMQSGSSDMDSHSDTDTESMGRWDFELTMGGGGEKANADVDTRSHAFTTSEGTKDVSSQMQQKIDSSTQQKSFSSRNKRASIVTELMDTESESISTRTITNYNHMHALTIEYWQVVQIYRTEVKLQNYRRCLFLPIEIFDFKDERLIERFKGILINAALNQYTRELLFATNSKVNVKLKAIPYFESFTEARKKAIEKAKLIARLLVLNRQGLLSDLNRNALSWNMNAQAELFNVKWDTNESTTLRNIRIIAEDGTEIEISNNGAGYSADTVNPDMGNPVPLSSIDNITANFENVTADFVQEISLRFRLPGNQLRSMTIKIFVKEGKTSVKLLEFDQPLLSNELSDLLNQNALYYSQQIWLNADVHFLTMQLSNLTYRGEPVVESIDPRPVAVAGNCLGFIWHKTDDREWKDWVDANINLNKITIQRIALPTDGVFAEAVLGRYNSAEKLDLTRFWNWQDSPIPVNAPDIAPVQAGQHVASQPLQPGNLDAPVVNIMNPPALPDPTGMQAIVQALIAGNIFRDMSGITQAAALANTTATNSAQSATALGQQVGANMNAQVDLAKSIFSSLASLAPMLFGLPPVGSVPGGKNISTAGAAFNAAKGLDAGGQSSSGGQSPNPNPLLLGSGSGNGTGSTTGSFGSGGLIAGNGRGETGNVMDMITGNRSVAGFGNGNTGNVVNAASTELGDTTLPGNLSDWADVFNHTVPQAIINAIEARNMSVQTFDFPDIDQIGLVAPLNLDKYEVHITTMPDKPGGGKYTKDELLQLIRLDFDNIISTIQSLGTEDILPLIIGSVMASGAFLTKNIAPLISAGIVMSDLAVKITNIGFGPLDNGIDDPVWRSNNYLGAVMQFDSLPDDMAVVVSKAVNDHWIFSTLRDNSRLPFAGPVGTHPVSGNRKFGYTTMPDGTIKLYTKGADRSSGNLETSTGEILFSGGDVLWRSFQIGIKNFVDSNNGAATILSPFSKRFNYRLVKQAMPQSV